MTLEQLFNFVQQGGAYCAPLLLLGLAWLAKDRQRLIDLNNAKDDELRKLAVQVITVTTELNIFLKYLFNERKK